jgi:L-lysine 6-transaminase
MSTLQTAPVIPPTHVLDALRRRILVDGFAIVIDPRRSHGSYLHDAPSGREFLDFYTFFASMPIGFNHPRLREPEFHAKLLNASIARIANADVYSQYYAEFVTAVDQIANPGGYPHFFFIDGGALAVENALKAAFDWKVRKNLAAGRGEIGQQIIHFRQAFHGRSGYTMSLTNTDPNKIMYFPKFDWPRIDNPRIDFSLSEPDRSQEVAGREQQALAQIHAAIEQHGHDLAAIIIEPIQGEGGDNHFRGEFLRALREICDQHEMLLIFDEVQTGGGCTGQMWCWQHFDVMPDIVCFGKKMQQCGIMASPRIDDVDNVFKISSRINSTWGGNLTDMVRAAQMLRIIHDEDLVAHAARVGAQLLDGLKRLAAKQPLVTHVRGRGIMCAFDLPTPEIRNQVRRACYERDMLVLNCGEKSIRFRPALDLEPADLERGLDLLDEALAAVAAAR